MWEVLLYAVISFLVILGLAELLRTVESLRVYRRQGSRALLILPLRGCTEDAEALLREGIIALEALPVAEARMAILDCGMSAEQRQMCELFCRDYSCAELFASDEICGIITDECRL